MGVTNTDNQELALKEKIKNFYFRSLAYMPDGHCPTSTTLAPTLEKWSLFCLFNLAYHKTLRFGELRKNIKGISARMLTVTLKRLEENGFVHREAYMEVPPRVEYSLTEFGQELAERLLALTGWFLEEYEERRKTGQDDLNGEKA